MMNRFTAAAACLFITGLVLVALSVLRGEGSAGIAICIPFFYGTGPLASLGVLCFFIGLILLFLGMARSAAEAAGPDGHDGQAEPDGPVAPAKPDGQDGPATPKGPAEGALRPRAGGVILIGPIPVVFGSDPGISRAMFYLALGLMAALLVILVLIAIF